MSDGFMEEEERITKAVLNQSGQDLQDRHQAISEEFMENVYDLHKFTTDPSLRKFYWKMQEIDKNWVLGNYNAKDEHIILMSEALVDDVDFLLPNGTRNNLIKTAILRDIFSRITISRGRKGSAAKLLVTQIGQTRAEITGLDKKKAGLFNWRRK